MAASHVKCRGNYDGCLGTAHRGAVLDLCKNCRIAREAELAEKGQTIHGKMRARESILRSAVSDVVGAPTVEGELYATRAHMLTETIRADAETHGHGVLKPEERWEIAKTTYDSAKGGAKRAVAYLKFFDPGQVKISDPETVSYGDRVEIRQLMRTEAATREELLNTYLLTDEALDKILAEPDPPEPEEEAVAVEEPVAVKPRGRHTPEHMAKMREARWAKQREKEAELERLRAEKAVMLTMDEAVFRNEGPQWTVTVLAPTDVTVAAPTFAAALKQAQDLYGSEAVIGIVKA